MRSVSSVYDMLAFSVAACVSGVRKAGRWNAIQGTEAFLNDAPGRGAAYVITQANRGAMSAPPSGMAALASLQLFTSGLKGGRSRRELGAGVSLP